MTRGRILIIAGIAVATVLAGVARYVDSIPRTVAFVISAIALAGLAWMVSFATEEVGRRFGPAVTGVMQSTLGNLPEFFVVLFALGSGQVVVAETSILGSILVNALLVLGIVFVVGARRSGGLMRFSARLPNDTATLLLSASFIILLIALSVGSGDRASHHITAISIVGSVVLLGVYLSWVVPYVRSDQGGHGGEEGEEEGTGVPFSVALTLLAVAGVGSAFVSDWFVNALEPTIKAVGFSEAFAGLVIVAIAGNAVENVVGIVLAHKGRNDLAVSVVKNSVAQIAAFLYPALVLVSLLFKHHLTFQLAPYLVGALIGTAIIIWQITGDGEASAFEGWALIGAFVVIGTVALYE